MLENSYSKVVARLALENYGPKVQIAKLAEELEELAYLLPSATEYAEWGERTDWDCLAETMDFLRFRDELTEEIADVLQVLESVIANFDLRKRVDQKAKQKAKRLHHRILKENIKEEGGVCFVQKNNFT